MIPIRKTRLREVKSLAQGHPATEGQGRTRTHFVCRSCGDSHTEESKATDRAAAGRRLPGGSGI